tara:strand:+ start:627 stop:1211 length:585 start_codon:yes stop_codon:yes gene_type:complete
MSSGFHEVSPGSFIYTLPNALETDFCEEVITRFENSSSHHKSGRIGQEASIDADIKRSTDLRISGLADWVDIDKAFLFSLQSGLSLLSGLHPFFKSNSFKDMGYQIQRSSSGEYYRWHIDTGPGPLSQRQLVAIWYLNNLDEKGGKTEFFHQNVSVTPEAGKLILFPPFWTHLHQGESVLASDKYIATTWICFA